MTVDAGALAIPEPRDASVAAVRDMLATLPALRERIREAGRLDAAEEMRRRLEALATYVGNRDAKKDVLAETRRAEVLIGELLGAGVRGGRQELNDHARSLKHPDRVRFRSLAEHAAVVEECIRRGHVTRARVLAEIDERRRAIRRATTLDTTPGGWHCDLRVGDFRTTLDDLTDVDAIVTDPPYPREYLPLYTDLAMWAADVLHPDGVLAVLAGQSHLPEVLARLTTERLRYRWTAAVLMPGAAVRIHTANLAAQWKPLVLLGGTSHPLGSDVIREPVLGADIGRAHHTWGQRTALMRAILERVTRPGWHVVDPFLGAGATALACRQIGSPFTGADIDPAAVQITRDRMSGAA